MGRRNAGLGRFHVGLLGARIKTRNDLIGGDVVADIDFALDDLAADPEREIVLHLCGNRAGQCRARRELDHLRGNDVDAGQGSLHLRCVLVAAGEQRERQHCGARSNQPRTPDRP